MPKSICKASHSIVKVQMRIFVICTSLLNEMIRISIHQPKLFVELGVLIIRLRAFIIQISNILDIVSFKIFIFMWSIGLQTALAKLCKASNFFFEMRICCLSSNTPNTKILEFITLQVEYNLVKFVDSQRASKGFTKIPSKWDFVCLGSETPILKIWG